MFSITLMNLITNMQTLDVLTAVEEGTFKRFLIVVLIAGVILATEKLENKIELKRIDDLQEKIKEIILYYKKNSLPTINSANQLNLKINLVAIDSCFVDCVKAYMNDYNSVVRDFNRINDEIISILKTGDTVYDRYDFLQEHISELDTLKLQRENCEKELQNIVNVADNINEIVIKYAEIPIPKIDSANQLGLKINISAVDECFAVCHEVYKEDYNSVVRDFNRINDEIISTLKTGDKVYDRYDFLQEHISELDALKLQRENCEKELQNIVNVADNINGIIIKYAEIPIPKIDSANQLGLKINISEVDECFAVCHEVYKDDYNSVIDFCNELSRQINSILSVVLPYNEKNSYLQEKSSILELLRMKREKTKTELTKVIETANNINAIIVKYLGDPMETESFTSRDHVKIYDKFIDKSFNALIDNYIARLNKSVDDYNIVNSRIKSILVKNGSCKEKYEFLRSSLKELNELQSEREKLFSEFLYCKNEKIVIPKDYKGLSSKLSNAFELANNSAKHNFNNLTLKNKLSAYALDRFSYDDSPFVISLGNIDYCIFGDVVLLFDSSGNYITALNHSALEISVEKHYEIIDIYSKYSYQNKTGYDSKCVNFGKTITTWEHTRVDGRPDRRYKNNPMIRHCYNTYEYGIITIKLGDAICSCTASSQKAITEFENIISNKKTGQYPNVIALSS